MNTVEHLSSSNSHHLRKKPYSFSIRGFVSITILTVVFITYLDAYLVKSLFISYPGRPFEKLFSVNILFNFALTPFYVVLFLYCLSKVNKWGRKGLVVFFSLLVPIMEKFAEQLKWFAHTSKWEHIYPFFGWLFVFALINIMYEWRSRK